MELGVLSHPWGSGRVTFFQPQACRTSRSHEAGMAHTGTSRGQSFLRPHLKGPNPVDFPELGRA